jgi:very-short-patch-repair endonuclease
MGTIFIEKIDGRSCGAWLIHKRELVLSCFCRLYSHQSDRRAIKRQQLRRNITKAEASIWQKLRCKQIENCKFRNQYSVEQFVLDFYSPEIKLAIEIDGESHFQEGAAHYDKERQIFIESTGINFLRFTNNQVYENLNGVLEIIAQKIRELRQ